jgi:hypothetical protein
MNKLTHPRHWILIAGAAAVLSACGGGGGTDAPNGTVTPVQPTSLNQVVLGTVTGFGSVIIEGVKYDDSVASVKVEDDSASPRNDVPSAVKLGMKVEVQADDNGRANTLKISPELFGKIAAGSRTADGFVVAGQTVKVSVVATQTTAVTVFEGVANLAGLADGDFVEVHGARDGSGNIVATRVERKDPSAAAAIRVTGTVSGFNSADKTFTVGGLIVKFDTATRMNPVGATIANGQRVAVWSDTPIAGNQLTAKSLSVRASGLANNDLARLGGVITDLNVPAKTFKLDGVDVDATRAQFDNGTLSDLANGRRVRVAGTFAASKVTADRIKFVKDQGDAKVELTGVITDFVSVSSFKVRGVPIDASALSVQFKNGNASNLANGVLVKIEGNAGSMVSPSELEFVTANDSRAAGFAGSISELSATGFKLSGVDIRLTPNTRYENNDVPATFAALANAKFVKVKGAFSGTVFVAAEVEVEDGGPGTGLRSLEGSITDVADISGGKTFLINGTRVNTGANTEFERGTAGTLTNGMRVEVYGALLNGEIRATKVEVKLPEASGTVRLRGVITDYVSATDFRVAGQRVSAAGISASGLANGVFVEVRGSIANNILAASELKLKD